MNYYVVKYSGPFGFIKPWTAVRDSETFSQQFLTPSIVEGLEKKLFPELMDKAKYPKGNIYKIKRHRLSYQQVSLQQEQTQPRGWNKVKNGFQRPNAILIRGVLLNPVLWLAFENEIDAEKAFQQHLCLCRNEDILYPDFIGSVSVDEFNTNKESFPGFELLFEKTDESFLVGYNRFRNNEAMYGKILTVGNPVIAF